MLKLKMYSIYDTQTAIFDTPFFANEDVNAKRHFVIVGRQKNSIVQQFPDKFDLYQLGVYDCTTGDFEQKSKVVMDGKDLKEQLDKML